MTERPTLNQLGLDTGKKARLRRILFDHGPGNGTSLFLPYDQGLEHGRRQTALRRYVQQPAGHRRGGPLG